MHRGFPPSLLLTLALSSSAFAQGEPPPRHQSPTPAWLPRGAFLGTYLQRGAVVPQVRAQWQLTFFQDRRDALALIVDGGLGRSVALPESAVEDLNIPFKAFYAHTVMAGGAYRNHTPSGWHWGFQVTAGPVWFGGRYERLENEDRVGGLLEGRVHVGHKAGPMVLGASVGYGEAFSVGRRGTARNYLGGLLLGLFADWR